MTRHTVPHLFERELANTFNKFSTSWKKCSTASGHAPPTTKQILLRWQRLDAYFDPFKIPLDLWIIVKKLFRNFRKNAATKLASASWSGLMDLWIRFSIS